MPTVRFRVDSLTHQPGQAVAIATGVVLSGTPDAGTTLRAGKSAAVPVLAVHPQLDQGRLALVVPAPSVALLRPGTVLRGRTSDRLVDRWGSLLAGVAGLVLAVATATGSWVYSNVMAPRQGRVDETEVTLADLGGFPAVLPAALVVAGALAVVAALLPGRARTVVAAFALGACALSAAAFVVASGRAVQARAEAVEAVLRARAGLGQPVWLVFSAPGAERAVLALGVLAVVSTVALSAVRDARHQVLAGVVLGLVAVVVPWARPAVPRGEEAELESQWLWSAGGAGVVLLVVLTVVLVVAPVAALAARRVPRPVLILLGAGVLAAAMAPWLLGVETELAARTPGLDHLPHDSGVIRLLAEIAMVTIAFGLWRLGFRRGASPRRR